MANPYADLSALLDTTRELTPEEMAELQLEQGYVDRALLIYDELARKDPSNTSYATRRAWLARMAARTLAARPVRERDRSAGGRPLATPTGGAARTDAVSESETRAPVPRSGPAVHEARPRRIAARPSPRRRLSTLKGVGPGSVEAPSASGDAVILVHRIVRVR